MLLKRKKKTKRQILVGYLIKLLKKTSACAERKAKALRKFE